MGARVFATAGTKEKLEICRQCGADEVVNYNKNDFVSAVKEWTGGRGVNVIFDPVGGQILELSTKCIAWEGRLLVIGFAAGTIPKIAANRILLKNISKLGSSNRVLELRGLCSSIHFYAVHALVEI